MPGQAGEMGRDSGPRGSVVLAPALHQNQLELLFPGLAGPVAPAHLKRWEAGRGVRRKGRGSPTGGPVH